MSDPIDNPITADSPLDAEVDLHALDDVTFEGRLTVLDRLGPAHFRSKGFSFMGFLQTVYDHVALHTGPQAKTFTPAEQVTDEPTPEAAPEAPSAEPTEAESSARETGSPETAAADTPVTTDASHADAPSTDDAQ